ncbi:MAG: RHS repeat-associated core domain-containing protein [Bacillota bacterium]|nr:RHS repeat-associated core domain-containing protein [Bacillota bacterium]
MYDGHGSVTQELRSGKEVNSYYYDPYGAVERGTEENDIIFGYNGEEYTEATQLQYLRQRHYAPEIGSFLTQDMYRGDLYEPNSQNRYTYAGNDPVNYNDPGGDKRRSVADKTSYGGSNRRGANKAETIAAANANLNKALSTVSGAAKNLYNTLTSSATTSAHNSARNTSNGKKTSVTTYTRQQMAKQAVESFKTSNNLFSMAEYLQQGFACDGDKGGTPNIADHKRKLTEEAKLQQLKEVASNGLPKFMYNMSEAFVGTLTFGQSYKGEDTTTPYYDDIHSGAAAIIGNFAGSGLGYAAYYTIGGPIFSSISKAAGGGIKGALVSSATGDLTIGLGQSLGMASVQGLEGEEAAKYVAANLAIDLTLGTGLGWLGDVGKGGKYSAFGKMSEADGIRYKEWNYDKIYEISIHNPNSNSMTLGKYFDGTLESSSYVARAELTGDTYFSLGDKWNDIKNTYGLSDKEMFDIFNTRALDDAVMQGKTIRFSQNPKEYPNSALEDEWEYLQGKHNYHDIIKKGEYWYAIK